MQERFNDNYPIEQNQLVFRTPPGSRHIPAGERVRLNDGLPNGIPIANFKTIRLYARCRPDGTVPVTFAIFVVDVEEEDLIFKLDGFTLKPEGETFTQTYDVSGRALVVFAQGGSGTGGTGIDFGVLGFGPLPCQDHHHPKCSGVFSAAYAGVVSTNAQTVANRAAVQFVPPITEINNVAFNGVDLFTIIVPGNYFCIGFIVPAADQEGPITVGIGLNGPAFGLFGSNNGAAAGQQAVCFGFTGEIPVGSTLGLYNASGRTIALGSTPARMAIFRVS